MQVNNCCLYHNWKEQECFFYFISMFSLFWCWDRKYSFFLIMEWSKICVFSTVGAGISALISIFDGLGPSIFRQKMGRTRILRNKMNGKGVYLPPESAFFIWCLMMKILFLICFWTWRVNNYVSRQWQAIKRRNECTKKTLAHTDVFN